MADAPSGKGDPTKSEQAEFLDQMTSLAQQRPHVFQTLIQQFFSPAEEEGTIALPAEVLAQAIESDRLREKQRHQLRLLLIGAGIFAFVAVLGFVLILVYLMRDHVEF